jgi:hypothetical protein
MLARVRRTGALLALLAFASGLLLPGSLVLHEPDDADAAWGAPGLVAGHAGTHVEPVLPPVGDEHCAICHWMRALTHSVSAAGSAGPEMRGVQADVAALPISVQVDISSLRPARAPPSSAL